MLIELDNQILILLQNIDKDIAGAILVRAGFRTDSVFVMRHGTICGRLSFDRPSL